MEFDVNFIRDTGIAGVAIFVIYQLMLKLFEFLSSRSKNESSNISQLIKKIDNLITTNQELIRVTYNSSIAFEKDQKEVINLLNDLSKTNEDIQLRTTRIDERTKKCLGDKKVTV